jgi:arsenite/tail-anchored protein-transporting ATPase
MRIILLTGKGGVGKTTIAAATALHAAGLGRRCTVVSADPAHSLADALDIELGPDPQPVTENLSAMEINAYREADRNWGVIANYLEKLFTSQGIEPIQAREMVILPGLEELLSLLAIKRLADDDNCDLLVVDCAPTGQTLRLLALPEALGFYFRRLFPVERQLMRAVRPLISGISPIALPEDSVYGALDLLYREVEELRTLLFDKQQTTARLVVNPEKMVVAESLRAYSALSLYDFATDAVIINKIWPAPGKLRKKTQTEMLGEIESSFSPLPLFKAELTDREVCGLKGLSELGEEIFGETDPGEILSEEEPFTIEKISEGYVLTLTAPGLSNRELDIWTRHDEVIIEMKNVRRRIALPQALIGLQVEKAKLKNKMLSITLTAD